MFTLPTFTSFELVEVGGLDDPKLDDYISTKTDEYGDKFEKGSHLFQGFFLC